MIESYNCELKNKYLPYSFILVSDPNLGGEFFSIFTMLLSAIFYWSMLKISSISSTGLRTSPLLFGSLRHYSGYGRVSHHARVLQEVPVGESSFFFIWYSLITWGEMWPRKWKPTQMDYWTCFRSPWSFPVTAQRIISFCRSTRARWWASTSGLCATPTTSWSTPSSPTACQSCRYDLSSGQHIMKIMHKNSASEPSS